MINVQLIFDIGIVVIFVLIYLWQEKQHKINRLQGKENNAIFERLNKLEKRRRK